MSHDPGTNAMQPGANQKPQHGKVVYSTDGKVLTDDQEGEGKKQGFAQAPDAEEKRGGT